MGESFKPTRAHKRYDVDWRVSLKCADWTLAGHVAAANASRGGVFVLTSQPPPSGTLVELGIELPDGATLTLRGIVQHVLTPERAAATGQAPGIGVKFLDEHETDLVLLEQMAATAISRAVSPPPPPAAVDAALARTLPVLGQITVKRRVLHRDGEVAPIVGIDLGNSYASIGATIGERVLVLADEAQRTLQPALVQLGERAAPISGWEARRRLLQHPRRTVVAPRRLLGRKIDDRALAAVLAASLVKIEGGPDGTPRAAVGAERHEPEALGAVVFAHLKALAERELRAPVARAVLSLPPHFDEPRAAALRRAAERAGFEVVALAPEAVGAAAATGVSPEVGRRVLVLDLGGSTLSVSLLEGDGTGFRVLGWEHEPLGGDHLDHAVAEVVADAFWRATGLEVRSRVETWLRLVAACERAKRDLSFIDESLITVEELVPEPRYDLQQPIDRARFEALTHEAVARCLAVCRALLQRLTVRPSQVDDVVLAGGSAHIPALQAGAAQLFERAPRVHAHPDEVSCLGATLRGAELARHRVTTIG